VDHRHPRLAEAGDETANRRNDRAEAGDVVAEALAEAAGLDEIALHVDHDQRCLRGIERELERLCVNHAHSQ
jgi:hypothetical protein